MKNFVKYGVVPLVIGAFLLCVTIMLLPTLINVQKFLPQIEQQVAEHTGRPFRVGSDFGLTFFPWLSVTFSDMHLGNKDGIAGDDFIQVDSFEARVKLLPLLFNKVEVSRFVVSGLNIHLKRDVDGRANYQLFQSSDNSTEDTQNFSHMTWLFNRDIAVDLFAVTGGAVHYDNDEIGKSHEITDLMVLFNNVSSTAKAKTEFKAFVDGYHLKGSGSVGPVSADVESLFMDLDVVINERIQATVKGDCSYPGGTPNCDLNVKMPTFILSDVYTDVAVKERALQQTLKLEGDIHGTMENFTIASGQGAIDDTSFSYSFDHKLDSGPSNNLDIHFKQLDLDRYFGGAKVDNESTGDVKGWPLIELWRNIPISIGLQADTIKLADIRFGKAGLKGVTENGVLHVTDGVFTLHEGEGTFDAEIGLSNQPVTVTSNVTITGVQADSFSKELIGAPVITGPLSGRFVLQRSEIPGSALGTSIVGKGFMEIEGGTITGIDLLATKQVESSSRTDFDKLVAELTLGNGITLLQPLTLLSSEGQSSLRAIVQLADKSFTVSPESEMDDDESLSIAGSYGPEGIAVDGYKDVHETMVYETRSAESLVDEKMPAPVEEDVTDIVGTPLIDPAIVAQRFGLRPELIKPDKAKKAYNVGRGRVIIRDLKELDSSILSN